MLSLISLGFGILILQYLTNYFRPGQNNQFKHRFKPKYKLDFQYRDITQIYKDAQEFDDESFNRYHSPMFQNVMRILYYDIDKDQDCIKILKLMQERGLDINEIISSSIEILYHHNTELMLAISYGRDIRPEAAMILLRNFNANPFITDQFGKNALHLLLFKGHEVQRHIVKEILNRNDIKDHINDKTNNGDTALHIACVRRDEQFIMQLLQYGANVTITNTNGQTPIDLMHLSETERLDFLISGISLRPEIKYYDPFALSDIIEPADSFHDVATIDKLIFNSDPYKLECKIQLNS